VLRNTAHTELPKMYAGCTKRIGLPRVAREFGIPALKSTMNLNGELNGRSSSTSKHTYMIAVLNSKFLFPSARIFQGHVKSFKSQEREISYYFFLSLDTQESQTYLEWKERTFTL
jgi:predicted nucleotide-binding protein (sugar kinase/HSP70/actin superfamily)